MGAPLSGLLAAVGVCLATGALGCGGGKGAPLDCAISIASATYSPVIGTVGVVTWSAASALDSAEIEFGLDARYGLTAPVDLAGPTLPDHRTLLLGMKEDAGPYHFRVVGKVAGETCTSGDQVFSTKTGARPADLARPTVTTHDPAALDGGFLVTVGYNANRANDYVFIVDVDGDIVWWYLPPGEFGALTAARMSYDGGHIWIAHANVPHINARVGRVNMDGTGWQDLRAEFNNQDHDLAVLPDDTIIYLSHQWNECDDIIERAPDGTTRTLINSAVVFGDAFICHSNAIQYSPWDDTVVVSDNDFSAYFKLTRQGEVVWVLNGGAFNSFDRSGGGATGGTGSIGSVGWKGNHNLHLLGLDRLVFFNNGVDGVADGVPAVARELKLDLEQMTTSEIWSYTADPPIASPILGDVQRLANGNTVVAYSAAGIVHEVSPDGVLLQQLAWGEPGEPGKPIGYITKRRSLYGPPPR